MPVQARPSSGARSASGACAVSSSERAPARPRGPPAPGWRASAAPRRAARPTSGGSGCSPRISSMRKRQLVGDLRGGLQPLGEVGPEPRHLLRPLERPLGVGGEAAAGLAPPWSPCRMQVRTSCSTCRPRAWVWTSFTTATVTPSRRPTERVAAIRSSSPATRWRETARAMRRPKSSRSRATAPSSAPGWSAKRPPARSPSARSGTPTSSRGRRGARGAPPALAAVGER